MKNIFLKISEMVSRNEMANKKLVLTFTTRNSWIFMVETTKFQSQNHEFFQENKLEKFIGFA
jgi:hypothetical protein